MRRLEDNTLLLLVVVVSLVFAWILWPFFGAVLWAAVLAIVFAPLHRRLLRSMPKQGNLAALIIVLIILALVILPLTVTAAALVDEAVNLHQRIESGELDFGRFFQDVLNALPAWASNLLDRLGLANLGAVKERLSAALTTGSSFFATQALDIGWSTASFIVSLLVMLYLLFFFLRDGDTLAKRITDAIPLPADQQRALISRSTAVIRAMVKGNLLIVGPVVASLFVAVWDIFSASRPHHRPEGRGAP
jgi:predicted PurR-regulated permease PerM